MNVNDTICAPATVAGSGAIAIIRISGPEAIGISDNIVRCVKGDISSARSYTIKYGVIEDSTRSVVDDVLLSVFRAPHSYTGEDSVEIYCHSSSYIVTKVLEMLTDAGCRLALPGEFTQRAFVNGKMDLSQAEAVADVIASSTEAEHRVAVNQMRGGYSSELRQLRDKLVELSSLLELELDFSEEDVEFADRSRLRELALKASSHSRRLADSFRIGNALKNGIPVAIVGAPNCGKSTLLNALLEEERAIVTDIPGTTRDSIEETCVLNGIRYRFIDTAGIRDASDIVEKMGIERTFDQMEKAEIIIGLIDGTLSGNETAEQTAAISGRVKPSQHLIIALNKADLVELSPVGSPAISISAKTGYGLENLKYAITSIHGLAGNNETLVTNARHASSLSSAADSLDKVILGIDSQIPADLIAEDLRASIAAISSILGETITPDEILGEIFSKFCIGK